MHCSNCVYVYYENILTDNRAIVIQGRSNFSSSLSLYLRVSFWMEFRGNREGLDESQVARTFRRNADPMFVQMLDKFQVNSFFKILLESCGYKTNFLRYLTLSLLTVATHTLLS